MKWVEIPNSFNESKTRGNCQTTRIIINILEHMSKQLFALVAWFLFVHMTNLVTGWEREKKTYRCRRVLLLDLGDPSFLLCLQIWKEAFTPFAQIMPDYDEVSFRLDAHMPDGNQLRFVTLCGTQSFFPVWQLKRKHSLVCKCPDASPFTLSVYEVEECSRMGPHKCEIGKILS